MGWNSSFMLAKKKSLKTLEGAIIDVYAVTDEKLDWETATSSQLHPNMALGVYGGWAVAWTPSVRAATDSEMLEKLSKRGCALAGMTYSHSSYHGFCYYAGGQLTRKLVRQNQTMLEQIGAPIPEEADLDWSDPEAAVFTLARRITGLDLTDIDVWGSVQFKLARL
jgi:hypothetical protein